MDTNTNIPEYKPKDFASDQDVRWCPGCGDYSVLKQVQTVLPTIGYKREDIVFVSGIGCSSRFPYYLNTYGMHSIHGRATAIASGLKAARPELSVWIITGDGDSLSIGGNHLIHLLRRNLNVNILMFNNEIYGLTKGQYSPTSPEGKRTKSSPLGSIDHRFNPLSLALGAEATFICRSMDRDPKHLQEAIKRCAAHKGTSLLEIYQNCNVFNDGAFEVFTDKKLKSDTTIYLEQGKPLVFGTDHQKGIRLNGFTPEIVDLSKGIFGLDDLWVHDETDRVKAQILNRFYDNPQEHGEAFPRPFGVVYQDQRNCYEDAMQGQINGAMEAKGSGKLDSLLSGKNTWTIA